MNKKPLLLILSLTIAFLPSLSLADAGFVGSTLLQSGGNSGTSNATALTSNPTQTQAQTDNTVNAGFLGNDSFDNVGSINYNDTSFGSTGVAGPSALDQISNGSLSGLPSPSANSQAGSTGSAQTGGTASGATGAIGNTGSCALGGILAKAVTSAISQLTSSQAADQAQKAQTVPENNPISDPKIAAQTAAHTGNITIGGLDVGISWDGLAYCAGNAAIQYIGNSMIRMINTGFNGNPAFVQNPQQFFSDIAATQASQFITALNRSSIAPPLQNTVARNLIGGYNSSFTGSQPNTWSAAQTQSYNSFTSGNPSGFSLSNLFNVSQNPSNNFYGSQMMAQNQMQSQIAQSVGLQQFQLQTNNGYLSSQKCQTINGKQVCNVVTPGSSIAAAGQNAQNLPNLRLAAENKFDQVISTLISQLIKTGLNKLMTSSSGH